VTPTSAAHRRVVRRTPRGFTLPELTVTRCIVGAVATMAIPQLADRSRSAAQTVTHSTLAQVRTAVRNYASDMFERLPYPDDSARARHPQLAYLYVNPQTYAAASGAAGLAAWAHDPTTSRGWAGPYLMAGGSYHVDAAKGFTALYGVEGDPTVVDGWGNPVVLQQPTMDSSNVYSATDRRYARLVSAGPDGLLNTPYDVALPGAAQIGDDVIVALGGTP